MIMTRFKVSCRIQTVALSHAWNVSMVCDQDVWFPVQGSIWTTWPSCPMTFSEWSNVELGTLLGKCSTYPVWWTPIPNNQPSPLHQPTQTLLKPHPALVVTKCQDCNLWISRPPQLTAPQENDLDLQPSPCHSPHFPFLPRFFFYSNLRHGLSTPSFNWLPQHSQHLYSCHKS